MITNYEAHGFLTELGGGGPAFNGLRDYLRQVEAYARALWAVRVLDNEARARGVDEGPYRPHWIGGEWEIVISGRLVRFADPDAARLAAAEAVYPTLPADVRAKLGVRP